MKKGQLHNSKIRYAATHRLVQLFERYYKGEATEREQRFIETWNPENTPVLHEIDEQQVEEGCDRVWQSLSQKYGLEEPSVRLASVTQKRKLFGLRTAVAAAVALLLIVSGSIYFLKDVQGKASRGECREILAKSSYETDRSIKKITFPDGSIVHLSYNTKLSFIPNAYNKEKRELWLEEGEAFFDVAKNPEKPFIVHHGGLQTVVRGTSFNIKAYKELKEETVSVRSGRVEVHSDDALLVTLTKNKQITYNTENRVFCQEDVEEETVAAWMDSRLVLFHANSLELRLRLKQFFDKEVVFDGNVLSDVLFYARFRQGASARDVLTVISELYDVKYEIGEHRIRIYK